MLLAIDPGTDTGWSLFDDSKRLVACGLGDPRTSPLVTGGFVTRLVVEKPRINPGGKARPNDMITLAVKTGRWTGIFDSVVDHVLVEPWQWKGSLSKEECADRVWTRLSTEERSVVERAKETGGVKGRAIAWGKVHNMMDAVGLGLHGVSRGMR